MPQTPNKLLRYPSPAEYPLGDVNIERLAFDMDTADTAEDVLRTAALRRPRASIYQATATQSIAKNAVVTLTGFDTIVYDNNAQVNLGVNSDRITCKTAGL